VDGLLHLKKERDQGRVYYYQIIPMFLDLYAMHRILPLKKEKGRKGGSIYQIIRMFLDL